MNGSPSRLLEPKNEENKKKGGGRKGSRVRAKGGGVNDPGGSGLKGKRGKEMQEKVATFEGELMY